MSLEEALTAVEQHLEQVSGALLSLDAPALETASTALRDAAARFTWVLEQSKGISAAQLPPRFEQRLAAIGQQLAVQRDNLARVSVITDRQVAVVVPQAGSAQSATSLRAMRPSGKVRRRRTPYSACWALFYRAFCSATRHLASWASRFFRPAASF